MLNIDAILTTVESIRAEEQKIMNRNDLGAWEFAAVNSRLDEIRSALTAEIARRESVKTGTNDAYKVFLRIIKNAPDRLKGAFYTDQAHLLCVCDGFRVIRMFRDDFNPPMLPAGQRGINADALFNLVDLSVREKIALPAVRDLKAYVKAEKAEMKARYSAKEIRSMDLHPYYALTDHSSAIILNAEFLLDVLEAIPDAELYAIKEGAVPNARFATVYAKGSDGDALVLPVRLGMDRMHEAVEKSYALRGGTYFNGEYRRTAEAV